MAPPTTRSKCSACHQPYNATNMVQCDACKKYLHFECVGVDESIRNRPWTCFPCGGDAYPPKKPTVEPISGEPTVDQLMSDMEEQQNLAKELERKLRVELEEERQRREKLSNEYEAMKRFLNQNTENVQEREEQQEDDHCSERSQRYSRIQREKEEWRNKVRDFRDGGAFNVAFGPNSQSTPRSVSSHYTPSPLGTTPNLSESNGNALNELATLMKRSHVEDLPKFSGTIKDWPLFLAVFKRTTQLASIDDVTNVGRLTKALEGEARSLVMDQLTYGLSPAEIIETLKRRYGREDEVLTTLTSDLLAFPVLSGLKDSRLQSFAIALKTYVAQLKSLGMERELKSNFVESMLLKKISNIQSWYARWTRLKRDEIDKDIEGLATFVMEQYEALPPIPASDTKIESGSGLKPRARAINLHSLVSEKDVKVCSACEGDHELPDCNDFLEANVNDRWEFVKAEKICFACLASKEHRANECPLQRNCTEPGCDRPHHLLLHKNQKLRRHNQQTLTKRDRSNRPAGDLVKPLNANALQFTPVATVAEASLGKTMGHHTIAVGHQMHEASEHKVTAKVVAVRVYGVDGKWLEEYAYLDDGSMLSLIDRSLAEQLGYDGTPETLHLRWTKGITRVEEAMKCDVTLSGLKASNKFTLCDVFCVADLDMSLVSQNGKEVSELYTHLRGLPLPSFEQVKPRILIGLEHASFLNGKQIISGGEDEPIAVKTKLGWVVYGKQVKSCAKSFANHRQHVQNTHTRLSESKNLDEQKLHDCAKSLFVTECIDVFKQQPRSRDDVRDDNRDKVPPKRRCVTDVAAEEDKMFHQIRIITKVQQCRRFLWRDGDEKRDPTVYVMQAMMFGPTCSPSQAQMVKNLRAMNYLESHSMAVNALLQNTVKVTSDSTQTCADMRRDLAQVQSNYDEFLKRMPAHNVKQEFVNLNVEKSPTLTTNLLGMYWKPGDDCCIFKRSFDDPPDSSLDRDQRLTKRKVLSILMKLFDLLGLFVKYIIRGKWILLEIWRERKDWDEEITEELAKQWTSFLGAFDEVERISILRWDGAIDSDQLKMELVILVDASVKPYAAVEDFYFAEGVEDVNVTVVMVKTKVAPVKHMSIPRLELEAAKIAKREQSSTKQRIVRSGDDVLKAEGGSDRNNWKLVHVIESIRAVTEYRELEMSVGTGETKYNRSVGKLAVLDVK